MLPGSKGGWRQKKNPSGFPAEEVIDGNAEELRKGEQRLRGGMSFAVFVISLSGAVYADGLCHLLLGQAVQETEGTDGFTK